MGVEDKRLNLLESQKVEETKQNKKFGHAHIHIKIVSVRPLGLGDVSMSTIGSFSYNEGGGGENLNPLLYLLPLLLDSPNHTSIRPYDHDVTGNTGKLHVKKSRISKVTKVEDVKNGGDPKVHL